jgi:acyl-CoA thioester hydrolase
MTAADFTLRVYYEDTDAGGVVYYANYLKFAERARTEALRDIGVEQQALLSTHGLAFVVSHCEARFKAPARLDDLLTIRTRLNDSGTASLTMRQTITKDGELLVDLTVRIGVVNAAFRPTRLPPALRDAIVSRLT